MLKEVLCSAETSVLLVLLTAGCVWMRSPSEQEPELWSHSCSLLQDVQMWGTGWWENLKTFKKTRKSFNIQLIIGRMLLC